MPPKKRKSGSSRSASSKSSARSTVGGPARARGAGGDAATDKLVATGELVAAMPNNDNKPLEYGKASRTPPAGTSVAPRTPSVTGSTLTESVASAKLGRGKPSLGANPGNLPLDHVRVDASGQRAHDQSGRPRRRQPEFAQGRAARPGAARRLHPAREDHALRSRAHSRAHRPRARLGRARLLRVLRAADEVHARLDLRRGRQADAGVRALLDRGRRARLDRHRARRARLRREVLHGRRQLGSGGQQHARLLHPGRDEVSRPDPRGQARAAPRDAAGSDGARHVLGLRLADARVDAHADVGDVGSRASRAAIA